MVKMGVATTSRSQRRDDIGSEKEGNIGNNIQKRSVGRPRKTLDQFVERAERGQRTGNTSRSKSTNDLLLTSSRNKSGSDSIRSSRSGGGGRRKNVIRESDDEDDDDEDQIGDRSIPIRRQTSQRKNASGSAAKTDGRRKSQSSSSQASSKQRGRKSKGDDQKAKKGSKALGAEEEDEEEVTRSTSPSPQRPSTEEEIQKRIEEENALMERWQEEYFEIVEQLPLELRRTYTLMRELETKFQDKIDLIAFDAKEYQNARKSYANLTEEQKEIQANIQRQLERQIAEEQKISTIQHQGQNLPTVEEEEVLLSSEADGEFEDDVEIFHELSGEPVKSETSPSSALQSLSSSEPEQQEIIQSDESPSDLAISTDIAIDSPISSSVIENFAELAPTKSSRLLLLSKIAKSSSESIRIAEEKVGLAVTAYEWVDRQIRRLDADLQKSENTLLLGLRAGTEASRGLQDALGIDYQNGQSAHRWDDIEALLMGRSTVQRQQEQQQTTTTRRRKQGKGKEDGGGQSSNSENDEEKTIILPNNTNEMAIDPNEPTYCYCDEVSSGEMIACDNEDCPREWFHLNCVGFDQPPKGKWFCLFCAIENNFKGSGSFPNNAPCLPSHLQSFTTSNGKNRKSGGKRKRVYSSAATANLSLINKNKQQRRK